MEDSVVYIDTSGYAVPKAGNSLMQNRKNAVQVQYQVNKIYISIMVVAYNRLDKTKRCVQSIIDNTKGIDYELILVDNGSSDDTLEYFKNVDFLKKKIYRIEKNMEALFPYNFLNLAELGKFFVNVSNDTIVTPNWLKNMLICAESDDSIGMICTASSNVSNLQQADLEFKDYKEMMKKAEAYNVSNPRKWQERLRLITIILLLKKETLMAIGFPVFDSGFYHDFGDDDVSFRVRRAGYKVILANDVWVHHDHDIRNMENKNPEEFKQSLEIGKNNFKDKYFGVDAWDDANNFLFDVVESIRPPKTNTGLKLLGIDVKCGAPLLDIKNKVRELGYFDADLSAFTQDPKYILDLRTICKDIVVCDREEYIRDNFPREYYDFIVMDCPLNRYHEPQKILNDIFMLAKPGAQIIFPFYNTFSFYEYLNTRGETDVYNPSFAYNIPFEVMKATLNKMCKVDSISARRFELGGNDIAYLRQCLEKDGKGKAVDECLSRMTIEVFWFVVSKPY